MLTLHRAQAITGYMSDAELSFLAETASKKYTIFEIGSYFGRSTRVLGDNCLGKVHAIDPWETDNFDGAERMSAFTTDFQTYNIFYCHMSDLIEKGKVIPERSTWMKWKPPYEADFIFIDGDHRCASVKRDIDKALLWIKPKGIIAGHDYALGWPGVMNAVNDTFSEMNFKLADSIWWIQL